MYCTADEVYGATTLTESVVSRSNVEFFILSASEQLCRFSHTIYLVEDDNGTATSSSSTVLTDSGASWTASTLKGHYVHIYDGTGAGQMRKITANTATTITVDAFTTTPDDTSKYRISYSIKSPIVEENLDGTNYPYMYLDSYPLIDIEALSIDSKDIDITKLYVYKDTGKVQLSQEAATSLFLSFPPQGISFNYSYGVSELPETEKRYIVLLASLKLLAAQMGGTYNTPSQYTLPEGSITIGQAYINIRGTFDVLQKEMTIVKDDIIKYQVVM